jgi:hypothetical protein
MPTKNSSKLRKWVIPYAASIVISLYLLLYWFVISDKYDVYQFAVLIAILILNGIVGTNAIKLGVFEKNR